MTWTAFKRLTFKINLAMILGGWLAFWGYGIAVGDVPPLSVLPGLAAMTLMSVVVVTLAVFLCCHLVLFARGKLNGTHPPFSKRDYTALAIGVLGVLLVIVVGQMFHTPSLDGLTVPLGIIGGVMAAFGLFYWVTGVAEQLLKWQFDPQSFTASD